MPGKKSFVGAILVASFAVLSLLISGCSSGDSTSPVAPNTPILSQSQGAADGYQVKVNFAARIETVDQNMRQLTFYGRPDTVEALQNAEIIQLQAGVETQSQFGEIVAGDSAHVYAYRNGSAHSYAYRICVVAPQEGCEYDVAFRGIIESIDYANATLTVEGRPELIQITVETEIWTVVPHQIGSTLSENSPACEESRYRYKEDQHILLEITDLQVGDEIEVRADYDEVDILSAVKIKLATECDNRSVMFESTVATIDYDAGIITFTDQQWIGTICPNAILLNSDGEPLALGEIVVGDMVAVKGYPLEDGTLRICRLTLLAI